MPITPWKDPDTNLVAVAVIAGGIGDDVACIGQTLAGGTVGRTLDQEQVLTLLVGETVTAGIPDGSEDLLLVSAEQTRIETGDDFHVPFRIRMEHLPFGTPPASGSATAEPPVALRPSENDLTPASAMRSSTR